MVKIARLQFTGELLREMLHLPEGTMFISAEKDAWSDTLTFLIHHRDLRDIGDAHTAEIITPTYSTHSISEHKFKSWY